MEEKEEAECSLNLHLIWDDTELDNINDDIMEEACVGNDFNLQSKGAPKINDFPSTFKADHQNRLKILGGIQPLLNPPQAWT